MKKKKGSKWKWVLWLLVLAAGISILMLPISRKTPKVHWRVPVQVSIPSLPDLRGHLPDIEGAIPEMPDVKMEDVRKLQDKVWEALPEVPPFPYEAEHKRDVEPSPITAGQPPGNKPVPPAVTPIEGGGARIAIIIDDVGLVPKLSERAMRLPSVVTLAFLPYAPRLQEQAEKAAAAGHDLLLHMPMEPMGRENPGPDALFVSDSPEKWKEKIDKSFKSFDGFIGVNNHMGSKFTIDTNAMRFFSDVLREKGLFFIDSRTNPKSVAEKVVREAGIRVAARDVFLDDTQTTAAVRTELVRAEKLARQKGSAIAIGHPHAVTLGELEAWIPDAQSRGFQIIPVREMVR